MARWRVALLILALVVACCSMLAVARMGAGPSAYALPAASPTSSVEAVSASSSGSSSTRSGGSAPDGPVPPSIQATVRRESLAVTLGVAPVDVGVAHFVATVRAHGHTLHDARVRIRLSMPAWPATFGTALLATTPCAGGYCGTGTLRALGRWRAVVLVRARGSAGVAAVPFDLMNGANARFLFAQPADTRFGPASVTLAQTPRGASTLRVLLRAGLRVRAVLSMPNMLSMGTAVYGARHAAGGWYTLSLSFAMTGVNQIVLQVRTAGGWATARTLLYDVAGDGRASLLTNTP